MLLNQCTSAHKWRKDNLSGLAHGSLRAAAPEKSAVRHLAGNLGRSGREQAQHDLPVTSSTLQSAVLLGQVAPIAGARTSAGPQGKLSGLPRVASRQEPTAATPPSPAERGWYRCCR